MAAEFQEGETVSLTLTAGNPPQTYTSRVLHVEGPNLTLRVPDGVGDITGKQVQVGKPNDKKAPPTAGEILKDSSPGSLRIFCAGLNSPEDQRRQMFRMDDQHPLEFSILPRAMHDQLAQTPSIDWHFGGKHHSGVIQDLSGSGLRLHTDFDLGFRECLMVRIQFEGRETKAVLGLAEVKRSHLLGISKSKPIWEASIHFTAMGASDRDAIVAYLLDKQRERVVR